MSRIQKNEDNVSALNDRIDEIELGSIKTANAPTGDEPHGAYSTKNSPFVTKNQSIATKLDIALVDYDPSEIRLGALAASLLSDDVKSELTADEAKAFNASVASGGGLLLPVGMSTIFVDATRPVTQVLNAGAQTTVMQQGTEVIPGIATPVVAGWRPTNGQFSPSGGSFKAVTLRARDVGAYCDIPSELMEDAGTVDAIDAIVINELTRAIAQAIDLAALFSMDTLGGAAPAVPLGITSVNANVVTSNYGIPQSTVTGTNGASATYDHIIAAAGVVSAANHVPNAALVAPRTATSLGTLKDTTGAYLAPPAYLNGVQQLVTGQLPTTLTKGSSSDTTISVVGDWRNLVIGFRPSVNISVLRDPFTLGLSRGTRLIVWVRADIAVVDPTAFCVVDGVRP